VLILIDLGIFAFLLMIPELYRYNTKRTATL